MAFRAEDAASSGYERVRKYLVSRQFSAFERQEADEALLRIIDECGPVVEGYPSWHPLVSNHSDRNPETLPSERSGYRRSDHTRYFAHGFVTCPYGDAQSVIDSVDQLPGNPVAHITAERLDVQLYAPGTTPVLVRCRWTKPLEPGKMIPKAVAIPLMLEKELPVWRWAERAESWETMRPYLIGEPHGSRSSLFVTQETALAIKNIYLAMVLSGMFGPLKMG